MGVALLKSRISESDVEVAWATYRALVLCGQDDAELANDPAHRLATTIASERFQRLCEEWCNQ